MATGTTADAVMKRNKLVESALRAVRAIEPGEQADHNIMAEGVKLLNEILREEDQDQTGIKKSLWALSENHLFLVVGDYVYSTTEGLAASIQDLQTVFYRDITGFDKAVDIISSRQYDALTQKNDTGDVQKLFLEVNNTLSSQVVRPWPVPASIGTTSEVIGSDGLNYKCILGHVSATYNKPITGASWRLYWTQQGSAGTTWATATTYTNGALLRLSYKRALYDFDLSDDDPDLPLGWGNYLKWRLAVELAPIYKIPLDERTWFDVRAGQAMKRLFPAMTTKTQDVHNKAQYF